MRIRKETLTAAQDWVQPTPDEVRALLLAMNLKTAEVAAYLNLAASGDRTVRAWTGTRTQIPYPSWALLVAKATGFNIANADEEITLSAWAVLNEKLKTTQG